eukprot:257467-Amphidinium_carterae.1
MVSRGEASRHPPTRPMRTVLIPPLDLFPCCLSRQALERERAKLMSWQSQSRLACDHGVVIDSQSECNSTDKSRLRHPILAIPSVTCSSCGVYGGEGHRESREALIEPGIAIVQRSFAGRSRRLTPRSAKLCSNLSGRQQSPIDGCSKGPQHKQSTMMTQTIGNGSNFPFQACSALLLILYVGHHWQSVLHRLHSSVRSLLLSDCLGEKL